MGHKESPLNYFSTVRWPKQEAKKIILPLPSNSVSRAAKIIAVAAYPREAELRQNGPGHNFYLSMMAWMYRGAKVRGKIGRLPKWAAKIKWQQVRNRCAAGERRLIFQFLSYLTISEASLIAIEKDHLKRGVIPGFTIRYSEDFGHIAIVFQSHTEEMLPQMWASAKRQSSSRVSDKKKIRFPNLRPGSIPASLRSAIMRHRKSFAVGAGDADIEYQNIYNRRIRVCFPVYHVVRILHRTLMKNPQNMSGPVANPVQQLLLSPGWAKDAPSEIASGAKWAVHTLRELDIPICECRLIGLPVSDQRGKC